MGDLLIEDLSSNFTYTLVKVAAVQYMITFSQTVKSKVQVCNQSCRPETVLFLDDKYDSMNDVEV